MGDAIAFQRMEAFVEEKRLDKGMAGGIAVEHRRKVGAHRLADAGIGARSLPRKSRAPASGLEILAAQLLGQMVGERMLQPVMLEDGGMDEAGQRRLAVRHRLGLLAQLRPDRIAAREFFAQ